MIVKVQIPLASNDPDPAGAPIMIYPRSGQPVWMVRPDKFDPETLKMVRRDCAATGKAFYEAVVLDGGVSLGSRVPDQRW